MPNVTEASPGDRCVDSEHQHPEARRAGALDQFGTRTAVASEVQLEPAVGIRLLRRERFGRRRTHGRESVGDAGHQPCTHYGELPFVMHHPSEPGGRKHEC